VITSGSSATQWRWRADAPQPALVRFVLLSMLLHATIVILFGTSHGGGAGRGEGVLDVLDVTLRRQPSLPDAGLRAGPGAETATGRALLQRADPQLAPVAPGRSEPMPAIEPATTSEPTPIEPATPASGQAQPEAAPPMPPAVEPLPRIDLRAPQEVDKSLIAPVAPPTIERLAPPPNPPALAAPLDIAPPVIPPAPAAPIERLSAPAIQHELAPPIELAPRVAPAPAAAPIERLAVPAAPKALAPPVEVPPREAPIVPAPIDRLAVPQIDQELAPSPNLVAPNPSVAPLAAPPEAAPSQVERAAPPASAKPAPVPATPEVAVPAPVPGARAVPGATTEPPRLRLGSPGPDEDIFKPRRDVAAPPGESGAPRIDMEAARQRAREIASESTSTRGIIPALPPPPERKSKESTALEKAIKPDCRTAYAGMGLLAVPALLASSIGDGGCRW
jgi:hypothetical protein